MNRNKGAPSEIVTPKVLIIKSCDEYIKQNLIVLGPLWAGLGNLKFTNFLYFFVLKVS